MLYRADGGHPVGMGHIMRALRVTRKLAEILDIQVLLVSRKNEAVTRVIAKEDLPYLEVHWLDPVENSILPVLGAEEFLDNAREYKPDVIIVDALDTPEQGMSNIAALGTKLVVQDDRGPGRVFADLIINFLVKEHDPTALKHGARLLQGPDYAPLAPEYETAHEKRRKTEPETARGVTVTMGGADAAGLAVKAGRALINVKSLHEVRFNVGPAFPHMKELEEVVAQAPWRSNILVNVPSLLPVFLDSDIAVVAGGITMHEVACCGVPSIAVCQPIDHQLMVADMLEKAGAMINMGYGVEADVDDIAKTVDSLASDQKKRQNMAKSGPKVVDGKGTMRVAEAIASLIREK